jgi:hypothetical protein
VNGYRFTLHKSLRLPAITRSLGAFSGAILGRLRFLSVAVEAKQSNKDEFERLTLIVCHLALLLHSAPLLLLYFSTLDRRLIQILSNLEAKDSRYQAMFRHGPCRHRDNAPRRCRR